MKQCIACGEVKPLEEYGKWIRTKDGLQSKCKACKREYDNQYYAGNASRQADQRVRNAKQLQKIKQYVRDFLSVHPCVDCGESDIIVLEFDHVRGEKLGNVADIVNRKKSLRLVQAEIEKCEVRCANCHRRVTVARRGSDLV